MDPKCPHHTGKGRGGRSPLAEVRGPPAPRAGPLQGLRERRIRMFGELILPLGSFLERIPMKRFLFCFGKLRDVEYCQCG